jgi:hypothetical protein
MKKEDENIYRTSSFFVSAFELLEVTYAMVWFVKFPALVPVRPALLLIPH